MIILLSGSSRRRYREDVLRVLAAPPGSWIQFRYSSDLVSEPLQRKLPTGVTGLVCAVDADLSTNSTLIAPIRFVTIESWVVTGNHFVINLSVQSFPKYFSSKEIVQELADAGINFKPIKSATSDTDAVVEGTYVFDHDLDNKLNGPLLGNWENLVEQLHTLPGYKECPFFWTVLSVTPGVVQDQLVKTNQQKQLHLRHKSSYCATLFVFYPKGNSWDGKEGVIRFSYPESVRSESPDEILIDSRYDLKYWHFNASSTNFFRRSKTWIRIDQDLPPWIEETKETRKQNWNLEVDFHVASPLTRVLFRSILGGFALAVGNLLTIMRHMDISTGEKVIYFFIILISASISFGLLMTDAKLHR